MDFAGLGPLCEERLHRLSQAVDVSPCRNPARRPLGQFVGALPGGRLRERVEHGLGLQLRRFAQIIDSEVELALRFIDRRTGGVVRDPGAVDLDGAAEVAQRTRIVVLFQPRGPASGKGVALP